MQSAPVSAKTLGDVSMESFSLERRRIDAKSNNELFAEMERVWRLIGHRPSRIEWENAGPTIAYITYRRRFGGWRNACELDSRLASAPRESRNERELGIS